MWNFVKTHKFKTVEVWKLLVILRWIKAKNYIIILVKWNFVKTHKFKMESVEIFKTYEV